MSTRISLVPPASLILAVQRMLRPLVRLLMSQGVGYAYFSRLAKAAFVDVAARDFPAEDGSTTDSRVSLLSGVQRREVKRLRTETVDFGTPDSVSLGAQLVARWCGEPAYLDAWGRPRPLPRLASRGADVSFESLVASVSKDIRSRAVLDEWLNLGVARLDDEDQVFLAESAFIPANGFDEKAYFLGKGLHDHLAAASHNLLGQQPALLDRMAYYDGLSESSVAALNEYGRQLAEEALQAFNKRALALQAEDVTQNSGQKTASQRVTFGTYFFTEAAAARGKDKD